MTSHGGQRLILPRHCLENYQFLASQACINNRNYNSRETTGENFSPRIGRGEYLFFSRGFVFDVRFCHLTTLPTRTEKKFAITFVSVVYSSPGNEQKSYLRDVSLIAD